MKNNKKICRIINTLEEWERYKLDNGNLYDTYTSAFIINPESYCIDEVYEYMKAGGMVVGK